MKKRKTVKRKRPAEKIIEGLREALHRIQGLDPVSIKVNLPEENWRILNSANKPNSNVHHPSHYGGADNPYETIKVARAKLTKEEYIGAMKFTVMKYNDRAKHKGTEIEDYEKGLWYQTELVKRAKEEN